MARRPDATAYPIYRCIYSKAGSHPTCVIAGNDRYHVWLNVYDRTPMALRLHPQVVHFLLEAVAELDARTESHVVDPGIMYG